MEKKMEAKVRNLKSDLDMFMELQREWVDKLARCANEALVDVDRLKSIMAEVERYDTLMLVCSNKIDVIEQLLEA